MPDFRCKVREVHLRQTMMVGVKSGQLPTRREFGRGDNGDVITRALKVLTAKVGFTSRAGPRSGNPAIHVIYISEATPSEMQLRLS